MNTGEHRRWAVWWKHSWSALAFTTSEPPPSPPPFLSTIFSKLPCKRRYHNRGTQPILRTCLLQVYRCISPHITKELYVKLSRVGFLAVEYNVLYTPIAKKYIIMDSYLPAVLSAYNSGPADSLADCAEWQSWRQSDRRKLERTGSSFCWNCGRRLTGRLLWRMWWSITQTAALQTTRNEYFIVRVPRLGFTFSKLQYS